MNPRTGILAGTFDPVHDGHIACCLDAKKNFGLESVTIMVEPNPWRKTEVTAYDLRYEMALIATQSYPDIILQYSTEERFSVDSTLPSILSKNEGTDVYYIVGADEYRHLPNWNNVADFVASVGFIVVLREGHTQNQVADTAKKLQQTCGLMPRYEILKSTYPLISSGKIRQTLSRTGHSDDLDPQVEAYIKDHKLYGNS